MPSWWCDLKQKNDCSRAERRGEGRDEFSLHKSAEKDRFGLDRPIWFNRSGLRTKPMGWVLQGQLRWNCSPVDPSDPSRLSRVTAGPGNNGDTDVQTRDCARFKSTEAFGVPSRVIDGSLANWRLDLSHLWGWRGRGCRYCRRRRGGGVFGRVRRIAGGSGERFWLRCESIGFWRCRR